ncbi:MAG: hypothetical protein JSR15_12250 [Proteobacteria bacterium]|nr:hypothetical protein [Pseudomonadota bacterium]
MATMIRTAPLLAFMLALAGAATGAEPKPTPAPTPAPTLDQIVARYVEARGGAQAWQRILAMGWTGHIESGPGGSQKIPFLMLFRRPNATRFEVVAQNQRSVRIFDGHHGWKQRPGGESGVELNEYTPEEVRAALDSGGLDGPLSGYQAKGIKLELQGAEIIEQRKAWKLKLTFPSGDVQWHWIDAENYHDLRYDREVRNAMGMSGVVSVYLRDYHTVEGLSVPLLIETRAPSGQAPDRMIIEKIAFNPTLSADTFERPVQAGVRHEGVVINTGDPRGSGAPQR